MAGGTLNSKARRGGTGLLNNNARSAGNNLLNSFAKRKGNVFPIFGNGVLSPLVNFSRASGGTTENTQGVFTQAAVNEPRYRYVGGFKELLIEGASTNLVFPSATAANQNVTTTAQSYTISFKGTGTVTRSGTSTGSLVGTGASNLVTQSFTATAGTLTLTVSGGVTEWQLETGSIATSYIPTTTAPVTRAADLASIPTSAIGWNPNEGTFVVQTRTDALNNGTIYSPCALSVSDGSQDKMIWLERGQPSSRFASFSRVAGVTNGSSVSAPLFASGVLNKLATSFDSSSASMAINASLSSSAFAIPAVNIVNIGSLPSGGGSWNGSFREITYQPRKLSNAELQAATT